MLFDQSISFLNLKYNKVGNECNEEHIFLYGHESAKADHDSK